MSLILLGIFILAVMYNGDVAGVAAVILGLAGLFYVLHPGRILLLFKKGGP